ncbi:MAG: hypothetical protein AAFU71_20290 [Cyanobacteria bacterium J06632_22]
MPNFESPNFDPPGGPPESSLGSLDNLRLSQADIDRLTGLDISERSMGRAARLSLFRQPRQILGWGLTVVLALGVALVLSIPVVLVLARSLTGTAETETMLRYVPVGVVSAIALTAAWQGYALYRGRQLLTLDHLLTEVSRYHEMLTAVEVYCELAMARGSQPAQIDAIVEALHLTRENLVNGLTSERVMRKHQRFIAQRQALFNRMEQNLSALQALQVVDAASTYGTLLNDALQIGVQVQKEMSTLRPQSFKIHSIE